MNLPPIEPLDPPPANESDEWGRIFRIFLLAALLGGGAAFVAISQFGSHQPGEESIRVYGSKVSVRSIGAGLAGGLVGLPLGATLVGLALGDPGRGALIGGFSCFLGAGIGSGCEDPIAAVIIGGLGAGIWCVARLSG